MIKGKNLDEVSIVYRGPQIGECPALPNARKVSIIGSLLVLEVPASEKLKEFSMTNIARAANTVHYYPSVTPNLVTMNLRNCVPFFKGPSDSLRTLYLYKSSLPKDMPPKLENLFVVVSKGDAGKWQRAMIDKAGIAKEKVHILEEQ